MHLTGKRKAELVYVLMNTPEELTYEDSIDYSEVDSKYRIKRYEIEYNEEDIYILQQVVLESREYIKEIIK